MSVEVGIDSGVRLAQDELRELFLFEHLSAEQLTWLADRGWVCPACRRTCR